ncbi:hypothetical protein FRB99_007947 [Tulasnella sp. 403]|nr:hypothetical protein FRB99_007947 [Tulasnella sp. 403]
MPLPPPPQQPEYARSVFRNNLDGETAYQRHQRYVRSAQLYGEQIGDSSTAKKTDFDVLKKAHRFLRPDDEDTSNLSYEDSVALKYYRNLFKEFAICDLKHYKSGNLGLRWRTDEEVVSGAGQFTCGNSRCAYHDPEGLKAHDMPPLITLELPFGYAELGEAKSAVVKVVLCSRCKKKLTWKRDKDKAGASKAEDLAENQTQRQRVARTGNGKHPGEDTRPSGQKSKVRTRDEEPDHRSSKRHRNRSRE